MKKNETKKRPPKSFMEKLRRLDLPAKTKQMLTNLWQDCRKVAVSIVEYL